MLRLRQLVRVAAALGWLAHRWFLMGCGEGERDTRAAAGDTLGAAVSRSAVQCLYDTWSEAAAVTSCWTSAWARGTAIL